MVNTELNSTVFGFSPNYNILNIVVNTELLNWKYGQFIYYNILNIVVNTERNDRFDYYNPYYNILNIVVNTALFLSRGTPFFLKTPYVTQTSGLCEDCRFPELLLRNQKSHRLDRSEESI